MKFISYLYTIKLKTFKQINKMEISNRLITEFMGLKVLTIEEFNKIPNVENLNIDEYSILEYQRYHCSWDWLMPVIEKIRYTDECSDFNINIDCDCKINCDDYKIEFEVYVYCDEVKTTLQACYIACVKFIKWYNTLK